MLYEVITGFDTVAVLAHGLDIIYPGTHLPVSQKIEKQGALLTEFLSGTNPDRQNFVKRNRIVAGMCDATLIVETGVKGGALITARLAASYNRDVRITSYNVCYTKLLRYYLHGYPIKTAAGITPK